jgi:predicted RNA-binding Zn-ribbon protein involved in translation (DUF1610 family)
MIGIMRLDENTRALREVSERMRKGHKSCDESHAPEASKQGEHAVIVPPTSALSSGRVAAVSSPIPSGRSFPSLPRPNDDDREPPEHSEVQGESRIRARARHDTAGSWFPKDPDDVAERVTKRLPRVRVINANDSTDRQDLPGCAACGSIDVRPQGGMFQCNTCGKVGALRSSDACPDSPHLSA